MTDEGRDLTEFNLTKSGAVLTLRPVGEVEINLYLKKVEKDWNANGRMLDPPEYRLRVGNPEKDEEVYEFHNHRVDPGRGINTLTEEYVPDPDELRLAKARWNKYQQDRRDWVAFREQAQIQYLLYRGVVDSPDGDSWAEALDVLGIEIPEDPVTRKVLWLELEHGIGDSERQQLLVQLRVLAMERTVDPEDLEAFLRDFKAKLAEEARSRLGRALAEQEPLDGPDAVHRAGNRQGVGPRRRAVGPAGQTGEGADDGKDNPGARDGGVGENDPDAE